MAQFAAGDARGAWSVIVPVKRLSVAKTRISLPVEQRIDLAAAHAHHTLRAVGECGDFGEVVVVTDDPRVAVELESGLNAALSHGIRQIHSDRVAMVSSDLPAMRARDLDDLLAVAGQHPAAVVADIAGSGTTVLTSRHLDIQPRFGTASLAAHVAAGAVDITSTAADGVRLDVDTLQALDDAVGLGVGPATTSLLTSWRR